MGLGLAVNQRQFNFTRTLWKWGTSLRIILKVWSNCTLWWRGIQEFDMVDRSDITSDRHQHSLFSKWMNCTLMEPTRVMLEQVGLCAKYRETVMEYINTSRVICHILGFAPRHMRRRNWLAKSRYWIYSGFPVCHFRMPRNPRPNFRSKPQPGMLLRCDDNSANIV